MNIHTIIIPDIHGRIFWKDVINKYPKDKYPNIPIVFLGDYVDPYNHEGISREDAIENFKEILETAKNDNRIHLLIGNHDMHYWYNAPYKSRVDHKNYNVIKELFLSNFDMFNVAYDEHIGDEYFLYTHAGVNKPWLDHLHNIGDFSMKSNIGKLSDEQKEYCKFLCTIRPCAEDINKLKDNFQGQANLWMASYARGGDYNVGSCIWEDLSEWRFAGMEIEGIWQIFGHSRWSKKDPDGPYIDYDRKFACLDTCTGWIITDKCEFIKC